MSAGDGDALLARADELLGTGAGFAPLVVSPLLIRRARSSGGVGGRRISAGLVRGDDDAEFAVLVEDHRAGRSLRAFSSATACVHAFNDELRQAERDGLAARPAAQATSVAALLRAGRAARLRPAARREVHRRVSADYPVRMATTAQSVADVCRTARSASRTLAAIGSATKDAALHAIADALEQRTAEILEANARDMEAGAEAGLSAALLDRLRLTEERVHAIAAGARQVASLEDPVGELVGGGRLANGLELRKVRVPLGVVAIVYEARPNVTIDAAALCLKSGNACVLRGSSSAAHSNTVLAGIAAEAAEQAGLPAGSVVLVSGGGREELAELATQEGVVDLIIPRGGEGLKAALKGVATVPVIYAASGNCHVYVDRSADLERAVAIALNAKTHRPGVCNAAETLLVHADVAAVFVPRAVGALREAGVELRVDARTRSLAGPDLGRDLAAATDEDWDTEFLALVLAVGVVDSLEEAIDHINTHGSGHSEAIVTADLDAARAFEHGVDAACVYINASTRFTDGAEFGMGSEIGNSTQKLHARGPIGLRELCTFKYVVTGDGHVRG